jgi:hypothetical protein
MEFTGAYTQTLVTTNCKRPFFTIFHTSRKEAEDGFLEIFTKTMGGSGSSTHTWYFIQLFVL